MVDHTHKYRTLTQFRNCCFSVAAVLVLGPVGGVVATAQGLSGPPQRLEETLGTASGGPQAAGGQSRGPQGSGSSGPPSGSSGPPSGSSGPPSGSGFSGPPAGYGEQDDSMDMMDMEASYGGSGGPASSRGRSRGGPSSDAMQAYGSSLTSLIKNLDLSPMFGPTQEVAVEGGPVLQREAEQAFKSGNLGLARELMFGHMAAEYKDAMVAIQTVKYSALLRRPVWNIRVGISIAVRGDGGSDAMPIRESANSSRLMANNGRGGPSRGGPSRGGPGEGDFEDYGSEMEESGMEEEMDRQMDMEMEMGMEMERGGRGGPGGAGGRGGPTARRASAPTMPTRSMLDPQAAEKLDKTLGLVAAVAADEFNKRFQSGDFGLIFSTLSAPVAVESNRGGGRAVAPQAGQSPISESLNEALSEAAEPLPMWRPGIVYLGEGTSDENIPLARAANLDVLLHFDVVLKPDRNGNSRNTSRLRAIHVATGKSIGVSKAMDNWEAAQLARAGRQGERAYVEEKLGYLFAILDRQVKAVDLPKLSPDVARRRVASLIASPQSRTLRTLAEIRLYQAQELISESEVEAAFDIIGSVDGLMLLHGPLNERLAMARQWAIDSQPEIGR